MAARDRLGGLSDETVAAVVLMRALFDRALVESVGIGQSEADISFAADTIILCIQPGSGDSLQFMKAGVMELPDIVVVTKADMGDAARRAKADVEGALTLFTRNDEWPQPVVLISAASGEGLSDLHAAIAAHRTHGARVMRGGTYAARRRAAQEQAWVQEALRARFGAEGLRVARAMMAPDSGPFERERALAAELSRRLGKA